MSEQDVWTVDDDNYSAAGLPRERVMICVEPTYKSTAHILRGASMAHKANGAFWVVYPRITGSVLSPQEETAVQALFALARHLGGEGIELHGESTARMIEDFARERQVTYIIM